MKRLLSVLLVFIMILGMSVTAFAAKQERTVVEITDGMSGKLQEVYAVNLLMGGRDIYTDVPSLLYTIKGKSRTLVPIRFVVENLGAQIEWDQKNKEATILAEEKTIVLKIDSAKAIVNGKECSLPNGVPAKLLGYQGNYRTMVPLRFIAEQLGMDVNWIQETTTATVDLPKQSITGIEFREYKDVPRVVIKTTGKVKLSPLYLPGSRFGGTDRLILDIPNTNIDINDPSLIKEGSEIKKKVYDMGVMTIRASLFEKSPRNVTRIVIDLALPRGYDVTFDEENNEIKVDFLNTVKSIKMENRNNADAIVIHTDEIPAYNVIDLGDRVVVDILNAKLKFDKNNILVSKNGVKRIRISQFNPDDNYDKDDKIVRVVLDLEKGQSFENIFVEDEGMDILVYVNSKPLQGFSYKKEAVNKSILKLSLEERDMYDEDYNDNNHELLLKVPKDQISLADTTLNIDDSMVKSIAIDDDGKYYHITIRLQDETTYKIKTVDDEKYNIQVEFKNKKIENSRYSGKMVVIDAGHGGKDPGASSSRLKEKHIALDTAQKLNKLLEEAGFSTYMTRADDTYVGLYERAAIANGLNADAFVSVHYNWHPNPKIRGVEVLYNGEDKSRDNKTFARIVKNEMVKGLKAVDHGIHNRPKLVVIRETKMPAILAEMGFMSNAGEEAKIVTESYRQKAAQTLFNGIKRYFDEVLLK
ncbi:N-acetylmuramoyl-L-alanine amidase family protein [Crassaminicella indica]|uniref:N-acetylmuramoyl-L-alanine amidase family protein n=1 Tax=Crassaminicella indica TaxID=2855394 RepID=A0ABX8RCI0_9CLOT|nr:N-acetylmuramoyl-L-alanine amidase family protein [Crassaminicella indica]QXM06506.1 N-acetylmuramoyl-L-alanine amidase family protein [Crassaminicella indica]